MSQENGPGSTYACHCGQEYMSEETLQRHQQTNCKTRSFFSCSFCEESLPSSVALREHLLLCGNKTDECPKCRQLIRRSHFAYHYENNCAPINEVETPPIGRRSPQRPPTNSNKPVAREDVPSDDYHENYPGQNPSMHPQRVNGRIQLNPRNSPVIIECEYCHRQYAQNDYKTHRDNCLRNPTNINYRQPPEIPLRPDQNRNHNQGASNDIAHVPCEICNQQVDLRNWASHTQTCREREAQRLNNRARSMSQEPVTEQLPCDYCHRLYKAKHLHSHEKNCPKNPNNMDSVDNRARPRPIPSFVLPIKQKNDRHVHYDIVDIDRTHAANRSPDNDRSNNHAGTNPQFIRRTASDDILSQPDNSPRSDDAYDNTPVRLNRDRSYENISQRHRHGPSNGTPQRGKPSSNNFRDIEQNPGASSDVNGNYSPYNKDRKQHHRIRGPHGTYEVIDNSPDRPLIKKNKPSWLKRFFCGFDSVQD